MFTPYHPNVSQADRRLGSFCEKSAITISALVILLVGSLIGSAFTGTAEARGGSSHSSSSSRSSSSSSRSSSSRPRTNSTPQQNQQMTPEQQASLRRAQVRRNAIRRANYRRLVFQRAHSRPRSTFYYGRPIRSRVRNCTPQMWRFHHPACDRYVLQNGYIVAPHSNTGKVVLYLFLGFIALVVIVALVLFFARRRNA